GRYGAAFRPTRSSASAPARSEIPLRCRGFAPLPPAISGVANEDVGSVFQCSRLLLAAWIGQIAALLAGAAVPRWRQHSVHVLGADNGLASKFLRLEGCINDNDCRFEPGASVRAAPMSAAWWVTSPPCGPRRRSSDIH